MKLRVLLVDENQERRILLEQALLQAGYLVSAPTDAGKDLMSAVQNTRADVIVIDVDSPDRDTLEHMCSIAREVPRPVVMFTHDDDAERMRTAIRAGVSAYVVDGLASDRVKHIVDVAVLRFEQHQTLRRELEQAKNSLAERKQIERAKGILMRQRNCGEEQAFQALRKMAMDRNRRLAEVAQSVIDAAELLG
jgi:response regulator NasT